MFWFDSTFILLLPALFFAIYAQLKVRSTYARFSQIANARGMTGAQAANFMLQANGITDVKVEMVPGRLTDHYDPRSRTLRLSRDVYLGRSIAAIGVAAHEAGHAVQHVTRYAPLVFRTSFYPLANIGSTLAFPLFLLGLLFGYRPLVDIGILAFSLAVIFTVVTLPVEFNASRRAMQAIESYGMLVGNEAAMAKQVLSAAALTYVAATAMALLQLLRLMLLRNSRS